MTHIDGVDTESALTDLLGFGRMPAPDAVRALGTEWADWGRDLGRPYLESLGHAARWLANNPVMELTDMGMRPRVVKPSCQPRESRETHEHAGRWSDVTDGGKFLWVPAQVKAALRAHPYTRLTLSQDPYVPLTVCMTQLAFALASMNLIPLAPDGTDGRPVEHGIKWAPPYTATVVHPIRTTVP